MEEGFNSREKRASPRISWRFIVKFKPHSIADLPVWETATVQNLSRGGCSFFSSAAYKVGDFLDIEIQLPLLREPMKFLGEVRRCEGEKDKKLLYNIGVQFIEMDTDKIDAFNQTVEFFLKKQTEGK
jgi:hypothetical protein